MPHRTLLRLFQWIALLVAIIAAASTPAVAQGNAHVVQRGETLFRIALRYGLSVDALVQANGIANPNQIYVGQVLVLPVPGNTPAPVPESAPAVSITVVSAPVYHVVQRGETLASIARRYGVNWQELASANGISNPNRILVGQQLSIPGTSAPNTAATAPAIPAPETAAPAPEPAAPGAAPITTDPSVTAAPNASQPQTHIVQRGESLSGIGRRYGLSWPVIARANNITDPNRIYPGQSLIIPVGGDSGSSQTYMEPTMGQPSGPTPTITNGKQIIVDLSEQRVYAFENGQLIHTTLASTGLPSTPTVLGDYNIYWKLTSQTMSGPGYYLPGVPWVMYFYQGYSLHGTYWHSNFGQPMSHGCVNLPTPEAEWFFNWAEIGTSVRVIL